VQKFGSQQSESADNASRMTSQEALPSTEPSRVLVVFGTRPEAIKMACVVRELREAEGFEVKVCVTAQHRKMLDQVLSIFGIDPDFDLDLMRPDQLLTELAASVLHGMREVYRRWRPHLVLVQGDTTTTFAASLSAFYENIAVGHIEAGLRTGNLHSPWPEEANRRLTSVISRYHFASTEWARANLLAEGVDPAAIVVTGNTVIDAFKEILRQISENREAQRRHAEEFAHLDSRKKLVLVTGHRRESFGEGFQRICTALRELAKRDDIQIVYPVHLNPNVRKPVEAILRGVDNVRLIEPIEYDSFVYLLNRSYIIITDSGGIQEEATYLGRPVLVMRDTTERPEAIEAGIAKLVGTNVGTIINEANHLLDNHHSYLAMAKSSHVFGDGLAARRVVEYLKAIKGAEIAATV